MAKFNPTGAGGSYGFFSQLAARHIGRFIPGAPTVVVQSMPGAGGQGGAPNVNKAADPYSAGQKGPLASAVRLMRRDPLPKGRGRIIADELSRTNYRGRIIKCRPATLLR